MSRGWAHGPQCRITYQPFSGLPGVQVLWLQALTSLRCMDDFGSPTLELRGSTPSTFKIPASLTSCTEDLVILCSNVSGYATPADGRGPACEGAL